MGILIISAALRKIYFLIRVVWFSLWARVRTCRIVKHDFRRCCRRVPAVASAERLETSLLPMPAWLPVPALPSAHHPAAAAAVSQFHSITLTQAIGLFCGEKSNFLSQSVWSSAKPLWSIERQMSAPDGRMVIPGAAWGLARTTEWQWARAAAVLPMHQPPKHNVTNAIRPFSRRLFISLARRLKI